MYAFENMQKSSKENMDTMMESFGTFSKGFQAIAVEMADYQKKAFEGTTAAAEKMMGAKSFDKVLEVQSDFAKTSYEDMVSQATKIGELYMDLAKDTYKPLEGMMPKAGK